MDYVYVAQVDSEGNKMRVETLILGSPFTKSLRLLRTFAVQRHLEQDRAHETQRLAQTFEQARGC